MRGNLPTEFPKCSEFCVKSLYISILKSPFKEPYKFDKCIWIQMYYPWYASNSDHTSVTLSFQTSL